MLTEGKGPWKWLVALTPNRNVIDVKRTELSPNFLLPWLHKNYIANSYTLKALKYFKTHPGLQNLLIFEARYNSSWVLSKDGKSLGELSMLLLARICSSQLVIGVNLVLKMSLGYGWDKPCTVFLLVVQSEVKICIFNIQNSSSSLTIITLTTWSWVRWLSRRCKDSSLGTTLRTLCTEFWCLVKIKLSPLILSHLPYWSIRNEK